MRDHNGNLHTFNEILGWLRLARSPHVGPHTFYKLLSRFGSVGSALEALPEMARRGGMAGKIKVCSVNSAEKEIEAHRKLGAILIPRDDPRYPPRLRFVDDAPPLISVLGQVDLLSKRAVAVIGARNASLNGQRFAEQLSCDLGENGLMVVSGLARGIDAAAHRGALASGTLAVLGGGVDIVYPLENSSIYEAIRERGVVVSELPPGTRPKARHFPRRNRIISGISRGVVVVEAAPRSGSLITARLALEQGREVFAVPGSAIDPRARGTNDLIRQGAYLTESATDVLEVIGSDRQVRLNPPPDMPPQSVGTNSGVPDERDCNDARQTIERWVGPTPTSMDTIMRQSDLPLSMLNEALLELELAGRLTRHPGNLISVAASP